MSIIEHVRSYVNESNNNDGEIDYFDNVQTHDGEY